MLLLWLGTFAMVASPQLHSLLHHDANAPEHHCLVTQIQQNQLLAGAAAMVVAPLLTAIGSICHAVDQFVLARDRRLSPSRAPPFGSSPQLVVG